jgi:hypothetical protein
MPTRQAIVGITSRSVGGKLLSPNRPPGSRPTPRYQLKIQTSTNGEPS